jgi:hypothetical protein
MKFKSIIIIPKIRVEYPDIEDPYDTFPLENKLIMNDMMLATINAL